MSRLLQASAGPDASEKNHLTFKTFGTNEKALAR